MGEGELREKDKDWSDHIIETDSGTLIIIGEVVDEQMYDELKDRVGVGECAIEIPAEFIDEYIAESTS